MLHIFKAPFATFEQLLWRILIQSEQPKLRLKFELIIRNLYTLHTCNNGKNVHEKSTTKDTATKNIFRQCFHQIEANLLVFITNHLTSFYVILNTDRKWAELKFFLYCLYEKKNSTNVKQQSTTERSSSN